MLLVPISLYCCLSQTLVCCRPFVLCSPWADMQWKCNMVNYFLHCVSKLSTFRISVIYCFVTIVGFTLELLSFNIPQGYLNVINLKCVATWWMLFSLRALITGLLSLLLRLSHYLRNPDEINLCCYFDKWLAIRLLRHSDTAAFIYQSSNFRFANTRHRNR